MQLMGSRPSRPGVPETEGRAFEPSLEWNALLLRRVACSVLLLLLIFFAVSHQKASGSTPDVEAALKSIAAQIVHNNDALSQLYVDFFITISEGEQTTTNRICAAYSSEAAFIDYMHGIDRFQEPWSDAARFQLWIGRAGDRVYKPFERLAFPGNDEFSNKYWSSPYCQSIGWHPKSQYFAGLDNHFYIGELFGEDHIGEMRIIDNAATIDDVSCIHIATKVESEEFWFAPAWNFAMVKRVSLKNEQQEGVSKTIVSSDFQQVAPNMWLPKRVSGEVHVRKGGRTKLNGTFTIDVAHLSVNAQIPSDTFAVHRTALGTITLDDEGRAASYESGGEDLLDIWGMWCVNRFSPTRTRPLAFWTVVATISNIVVIAIAMACLLMARVRRKVPPRC